MRSDLAAARTAYELGRLRTSLWRAALLSAPLAVLAFFVVGAPALMWLPVTLSAWLIAFWRGGGILRGAMYGLLGGVITFALPMSILRPCCANMSTSGECCTMPGACLASGAVVGVLLAAMVPTGKATWWRTALGLALGVASVAMLRCSTLYLGEAIGLVGGVLLGVGVASSARVVVTRAR